MSLLQTAIGNAARRHCLRRWEKEAFTFVAVATGAVMDFYDGGIPLMASPGEQAALRLAEERERTAKGEYRYCRLARLRNAWQKWTARTALQIRYGLRVTTARSIRIERIGQEIRTLRADQ